MFKSLFSFLFIFTLVINSFGQDFEFAIIQDKDGYVNVRESKSSKSKVLDKLNDGELIYHHGKEVNWIDVNYIRNDTDVSGFVYFDRVKSVSEYQNIKCLESSENQILFNSNDIFISITKQKFNKKLHKLKFNKKYQDVLDEIDGKRIYGTDGNLPKHEYSSFKIIVNSKELNLPNEGFKNLFEPNFYFTKINYDKENDRLFIQSLNSDGAGGYAVIWYFEKGIYKGRFVTIPF